MTTKAYSYLRMSTETQLKGDSLRRQLEASQKYAEQNGLQLVEQLQDIGVSAFRGRNVKEGTLGKFLAVIEQRQIEPGSVLLVESLDRLSRDKVLKAFNQFTGILEAGITIVTLTDEQKYTKESVNQDMGQLFMSLGIMLRANEESATKSKRLKAAWTNKRNNLDSKKLTSTCPAWLTLDKDTNEFQIDEQKAAIVREIFDRTIPTAGNEEGEGVFAISRHFNGNLDKYPPFGRANKWHKSYLTKILTNPAVYGVFQPHKMVEGKRVPDGKPIPDYFPPVVSEDVFSLAQSARTERTIAGGGRQGETFSNLFMKLGKCGDCGGTIVFRDKGKPPKGGKYLRCFESESNRECTSPSWRYQHFEDSFLLHINDIDASTLVGSSSDLRKAINNVKQQIATEEAKLLRTQDTKEKFIKMALEGEMPDFLREAGFKVEAEEKEIKKRIKNLKSTLKAKQYEFENSDEKIQALSQLIRKMQGLEGIELRDLRAKLSGLLRQVVDHIEMYAKGSNGGDDSVPYFVVHYKSGEKRTVIVNPKDTTDLFTTTKMDADRLIEMAAKSLEHVDFAALRKHFKGSKPKLVVNYDKVQKG